MWSGKCIFNVMMQLLLAILKVEASNAFAILINIARI